MTEEQRGARLGEGKTKVIYECATNPHQVIIVSKDKLSAGNGAKFDVLPGKAEFSNVTTCNVFRLLNLSGVATHFVQQDSADSMRALNCAMIPLEVIVRRVAAGSYVKRFPTVKEGTVFSNCVVEFTFKDDQHGDPLVTDDEIIDMKLVKNGLTVDRDVIEKLKSEAVRTFEVVEAAWKMQDVTLVDFKVEFGVTSQGQLVLGDVIDNDSWRIWPGGDKNQMKDKQVYRNMTTKLLDEEGIKVLRDNYEWVMKATGRFVDAVPKHQSWSSNVCGNYPLVGVIMGSQTDWETMKNATAVLSELEIPFETRIVSAHRTPDRLVAYAKTAKSRGLKVIIAGAGGAAHLPGMVAAMTTLPVFGVPVQSRSLNGLDSLLSIVQMPGGIPVGTLAIGTSGAQNAGLLAASVIASSGNFPKIDSNLERWRAARTAAVALSPEDNVVNPHSNVAVQSNNNNNSDKKQSSLFCQLQAIRRKNNSTGYKFPPRLLTPFNTVIGVMGGGQLARMFSLAAANLGYKVHVFTPEKDSPCEQVCAYTTNAQYDDCAALDYFASQVDVITYEFENINADAIEYLEQWRPVYPSSSVLRICQDRLKEKTFVSSLGIPTAKFQHVTNAEELKSALAVIGYPAVLKTNTMGYDGKGQIKIQEGDDIDSCWTNLNTKAAILESFVPFDMEVSVIVAQSPSGAQKLYPVMENLHKNHILDFTYVPARNLPSELEKKALDVASKIAANINLVGLIAVEMFVRLADGEVLVNELAPRPHNSGHWTMDGCVTSQFEQLTRCLCSLPLGSTEVIGTQVVMKNLIGNDVLDYMNFLRQDSTHHADSHLHIYGKAEAREGRKMGHVNTVYRKSE